jgi:hypothetical protein
MKKIFFYAIVITIVSCNSSKVKPKPVMQGAYFMTSQTVNDGKKDTKYTDLKQLKIYTDSFFMYTQLNPSDSVSGFGVGTYSTDTGTVIENSIFVARDTTSNTSAPTYKLTITTDPDGYEQIIPDIMIDSTKSKLTEEYQRVSINSKTPLDGVWKQTAFYTIKGNDTTKNEQIEYKAFYAGYFMFGSFLREAGANHDRAVIGFGTFTMDGNNKVKETDLNATYSIAVGQSFDIDIEMNGPDQYKQTIMNSDGTKSVELYERLK